VAFALSLLPASGWAQDDDLLAPLTPGQKQPKVKRKRQPPHPKGGDDLLSPLSAAHAELLVTVEGGISGAHLFVDERDMGAVTGQPVQVPGGEHRVVVRRLGFADYGVMMKLHEGEREEVEVQLEPVAGVVTIQANVAGAEVTIDGKGVGKVPLHELLVPPGLHEIRVERDGYPAEVTKITIRGGKDYTFNSLLTPRQGVASSDRPKNANLTPANPLGGTPLAPAPNPMADSSPAWYGQWYVWAGAAALVAAAAGGTYVAVQSQSGFTPDQVCAPSRCVDVVNGPALRALRGRAPARAILIPSIAF